MAYCETCGCRTCNGICSNCQEELFIYTYQIDDCPALSKEFMEKVDDQKAARKAIKQYE
jgi:hypothetical protein